MADPESRLPDLDIDASNVRPAFEASLTVGVSESEIEQRLGWTRANLAQDGAVVSGASTYAHMEWMVQRPGFAGFVLTAARGHGAASLGVVGLACKTAATVGEALHCHQRFQHLTNRTANYVSGVERGQFVIRETRFGAPTLGSRLVSDYALLVAVHLFRSLLGPSLPLRALRSRRADLPTAERDAWETFAGVPIEAGAEHAQLVFDASLVAQPLPSADPELARYFGDVLRRSAPQPTPASDGGADPSLEARVRVQIVERLRHGTPNAGEVATALGLGARTLARRLAESEQTFGRVLESVRREQAQRYLSDTSLRLAEVAYLLGYAEHASFYRAFRRWFGVTPSAYRAQALASSAGPAKTR